MIFKEEETADPQEQGDMQAIEEMISTLAINKSYVLIYPSKSFSQGKLKKHINASMKPFLLILEKAEETTKQALAMLYIQFLELPFQHTQLHFWEQKTGLPLQRMTLGELKRRLGRESIRGLSFEVNICNLSDNSTFEDDIKYFTSSDSNEQLGKSFQLPNLSKTYSSNLPSANKSYKQINESNQFIVFSILPSRKFIYSQIKSIILSTIFDTQLQFKKRNMNSSKFGLRIRNIIIRPHEKLCNFKDVQILLATHMNEVKLVYAEIISQSDYLHSQNLVFSDGTISVDDQCSCPYAKSQNNEQIYASCEEKITKAAQNTDRIQIKNNNRLLLPILLYTSRITVNQNKILRLRNAINLYLQKFQFSKMKSYSDFQWRFRMAQKLVRSLKLMPLFIGTVYLGVSHHQVSKVGENLRYKQFLGGWTSKQDALPHAQTALYVIQSKSGRSIQEFSQLPSEQVMFLPNTTFQVREIIPKQTQNNKKLQIIQLEEMHSDDLITATPQLFILWVNKQTSEGMLYSKRDWNSLKQTITFVHMTSTQQLKKWIALHINAIQKSDIKLALITNMVRDQNGTANLTAGVDAIKEFRKYSNDGQIGVYIRSIQNTIEVLSKCQIAINDKLKVINEVQIFLANLIC